MAAPVPGSVTLKIRAPLERSDLPGLYERTCALLAGAGTDVLLCEVTGLTADAVTVDALARLALGSRRSGCQVRLLGSSPELRGLVELMGLAGVLGE
jgi:ABC-type transporter Mla MlaB component